MATRWTRRDMLVRLAPAAGALWVAAACSAAPQAAPTTAPQPAGASSSGGSQAGTNAAPAQKTLTTVVFRQSWIPDEIFLPFMAADKMGFYKDEGIQLSNQVGDGGATAVKLVANGDALMGSGEASNVLIGAAQGVPVVAVAAQFQDTPGAILTLKESGISSLEQLKGKKVGGSSASSVSVAYRAALSLKGIEQSAVQFVNIAPPGEQTALLQNQIDGAVQFAGNVTALEARGATVNTIALRDAGLKIPGTALFVRKDTLDKNPDLVKAFLRATLRGMKAALDKPDEAVAAEKANYPDINEKVVSAAWKITRQFLTSELTPEKGLGWQDKARWETLERIWREAKLTDKPVDVTTCFTNTILEQIPIDMRKA